MADSDDIEIVAPSKPQATQATQARSRNKPKELTPALITDMLRSHYHDGDNDTAVCKKYGVHRPVWKDIKEKHGAKFVERFGQRKQVEVADVDLDTYWEKAADTIGPAPSVIAPRAKKAAARAPAAAAPAPLPASAAAPAPKARTRK